MKVSTKSTAFVAVCAVAIFAISCTEQSDEADSNPAEANPETAFIQAAESAKGDLVGFDYNEPTPADAVENVVVESELAPSDAPVVFAFDFEDDVDSVEVKDIPIVATDVESLVESELDVETLLDMAIHALENRLMEIWDNSIEGVVLINLETGFFAGSGTGAGWFWDDDGHIVTNLHVVRPTSSFITPNVVIVETIHGDRYEAEFVGGDNVSDIAVIKIDVDPETYNALPLGDSSILRPGMAAIALGHPFGIEQSFSMTHGIISGLSRSIQSDGSTIPIPAVIQTDADMNPGNSGGPLLNSAGQVIGVNTQIRSITNVNSGVGFATPINLVRRVVNNLIENGVHEYPLIGISSWVVTPALAEQLGLASNQRGLIVTSVSPDGPANRAGIIPDTGTITDTGFRTPKGDGDVIVRIDNVKIDDLSDLRTYIMLETSPGDSIVIEVLRDGKIVPINVTLGSWGDRFN